MAFTLAEERNWISESAQRRMSLSNLRLQRSLQRWLPASVVDKYGYPEEVLTSMIEGIEKGYTEQAVNDRMTFDEVLSQCELSEQIGFLEEHAAEEIPYFYIADVFHAWARLHEGTVMHSEKLHRKPTEGRGHSEGAHIVGAGPLVLRNVPELDSEILCTSLWEKMLRDVIPFDVSIRALSVLAVNNKANAKRLAALANVNDLLSCYEAYEQAERERNRETAREEALVSHAEVYAAVMFFLRAINDASIRTRWIPGIGQPSTGRYPLAARVDADRWCRLFAPSQAAAPDVELVAEPAALLCDVLCERLRCSERPLTDA